jgi:hypothetical protein
MVGGKNKQRLLDCLQQHGVRDMSAKRYIVTETMVAEKARVTVTETEEVEKGLACTLPAAASTRVAQTDHHIKRDRGQN